MTSRVILCLLPIIQSLTSIRHLLEMYRRQLRACPLRRKLGSARAGFSYYREDGLPMPGGVTSPMIPISSGFWSFRFGLQARFEYVYDFGGNSDAAIQAYKQT
jgi:hypothetical protein